MLNQKRQAFLRSETLVVFFFNSIYFTGLLRLWPPCTHFLILCFVTLGYRFSAWLTLPHSILRFDVNWTKMTKNEGTNGFLSSTKIACPEKVWFMNLFHLNISVWPIRVISWWCNTMRGINWRYYLSPVSMPNLAESSPSWILIQLLGVFSFFSHCTL